MIFFNIDNIYFDKFEYGKSIYPSELPFNICATEASFVDLHDIIISYKIYDKREDSKIEMVKLPF